MYSPQDLTDGYVCAPYMHNHDSIELKDIWSHSKNIHDMYFVTATFSNEAKPYFTSCANHYILAKFKDNKKILKELEKFKLEKASFIFNMDDGLFERETNGSMNFVSVYYLEYGDSIDDFREVANVISKRDKIGCAGIGHMDVFSNEPPKFTFPYGDNIVILEVSSEKSHQSVNQYCEKTRRDVCRKGITLTNLVSLSILDKLK
ncbi:MAG: hypothetical protein NPMRTH1_300011 [Nitrosopumilales archaeon]|nr:MAG: hypothetical protein NPMRTH1_300011 [Nitrosopumilales archaeon]